MPVAAKLESVPGPLDRGQHGSPPRPRDGGRTKIVRDFAMLLGAALTTGLTAGLGMMLAVLALA